MGSGSCGPDRCWRPWGCRWESRSVLLRKRRCCLPRRRSWVWGFGGPRRRSQGTPRSGTLLETRDTSWTWSWSQGRGPVLLVLKLTDVKAENPRETLRGIWTGRPSKQVQPTSDDTEGGDGSEPNPLENSRSRPDHFKGTTTRSGPGGQDRDFCTVLTLWVIVYQRVCPALAGGTSPLWGICSQLRSSAATVSTTTC